MRPYQHSGKAPLGGVGLTLAAGSLAALVLGVAYTLAFYNILHVYLNVLLTFAFGGAIGWTVGFVAKEGKIRNVSVVAALAVGVALIGIYAAWGTTSYAMLPAESWPQAWRDRGLRPFLPHNVIGLAAFLYREGSWGTTANATVHGPPLAALWVVEAGIIGSLAAYVAVRQIADVAFCEKCEEWVVGREPHLFAGNGYGSVWSDVRHGVFESLAQTPRAAGNEDFFVRLSVSECPQCSASNFLSVVACEHRVNSKGRRYLVERKLALNVPLTAAQVEIVEAAAMIAPAIGANPDSPAAFTFDAPQPEPAAREPVEAA